jgi:hypothetical protein
MTRRIEPALARARDHVGDDVEARLGLRHSAVFPVGRPAVFSALCVLRVPLDRTAWQPKLIDKPSGDRAARWRTFMDD